MKPINMADDSHILSPPEMAARLAVLAEGAKADYYGNGGAVEVFEQQVAAFLGKERAMMFPTGTLGNLLVLQRLAGGAPARVVVHRQSHLFNDAGDNLAQLAGLTMVPLEDEGAGFAAASLQSEIERTRSARIVSRIGAVAIESPSRRLHGRRFGAGLPEVIELAREHGLPLFLDGARMLIECAWTGQSPADAAAPFDAVYMSLYKYLAAPFGCILAGSAALFDGMYHDRRRFGGSLYQMWPAAVLAADALPRQASLLAEARSVGERVIALLIDAGLPVTVFDDGSNVFLLECAHAPEEAVARASAIGIKILEPSGRTLSLKINETWIGRDSVDIVSRLRRLLE